MLRRQVAVPVHRPYPVTYRSMQRVDAIVDNIHAPFPLRKTR